VDTCLAPFALRTSQPAVEPSWQPLWNGPGSGFNLNLLLECGQTLENAAPKYRDYLSKHQMSVIDTGCWSTRFRRHDFQPGESAQRGQSPSSPSRGLPGGGAHTKRIGNPAVVTPTSQIVGVQAVLNVLSANTRWSPTKSRTSFTAFTGKRRPRWILKCRRKFSRDTSG